MARTTCVSCHVPGTDLISNGPGIPFSHTLTMLTHRHTHMCIHTYTCTHTHTCTHRHTLTHRPTNTGMHAHKQRHAHMHTQAHKHAHTHSMGTIRQTAGKGKPCSDDRVVCSWSGPGCALQAVLDHPSALSSVQRHHHSPPHPSVVCGNSVTLPTPVLQGLLHRKPWILSISSRREGTVPSGLQCTVRGWP